jgi:hypothetical protein
MIRVDLYRKGEWSWHSKLRMWFWCMGLSPTAPAGKPSLIPLPDHFEYAATPSPLSNYRSPGLESIQTDLGSVLATVGPKMAALRDGPFRESLGGYSRV